LKDRKKWVNQGQLKFLSMALGRAVFSPTPRNELVFDRVNDLNHTKQVVFLSPKVIF